MKRYWVDINSFQVEAEDEDEACKIAEKMIRENPYDYASDFEINFDSEVDD